MTPLTQDFLGATILFWKLLKIQMLAINVSGTVVSAIGRANIEEKKITDYLFLTFSYLLWVYIFRATKLAINLFVIIRFLPFLFKRFRFNYKAHSDFFFFPIKLSVQFFSNHFSKNFFFLCLLREAVFLPPVRKFFLRPRMSPANKLRLAFGTFDRVHDNCGKAIKDRLIT